MGGTFKFKTEKTYTFTEKELARLLSNHLCMYFTISSGKIIPESAVKLLNYKTMDEMRDNNLIDNLNREYSTIIEEAQKKQEKE